MKYIILALIIISLFLSGCAKTPGQLAKSGKQLVITVKVAGRFQTVDENDPSIKKYYFIAIDNDNNTLTGPWAVIGAPFGGNGWVTSANAVKSVGLTSYFEYDSQNPSGNIYGVLPGSFFLNTTAPVPPIRTELLDGGSTLRVTIDFNQISTTSIPVNAIRQLDINFITTNQLAVNPENTYPGRKWDALGPSGQDYVSIDTTANRTYSDNPSQGNVNDPDLDIIYWSIEVQDISSN